jgi:hypothetical protein
MTTNEKIAIWLGLKHDWKKIWIHPNGKDFIILDFLHDRNQQKWIIDELIKRGYRIQITYTEYGTSANIWHNDNQTEFHKSNDKIDDSAFIECVLELIEKEKVKC